MNKFRLILLSILLSTFSLGANAAISAEGTVEILYPANPSLVYFRLKGDVCTVAQYFKFSLTTEEGKAWYSLLLAAANTSKPVIVAATECPTGSAITVSYIYQKF